MGDAETLAAIFVPLCSCAVLLFFGVMVFPSTRAGLAARLRGKRGSDVDDAAAVSYNRWHSATRLRTALRSGSRRPDPPRARRSSGAHRPGVGAREARRGDGIVSGTGRLRPALPPPSRWRCAAPSPETPVPAPP